MRAAGEGRGGGAVAWEEDAVQEGLLEWGSPACWVGAEKEPGEGMK